MKLKTRSPYVRTLIRQIPAEARDIPDIVVGAPASSRPGRRALEAGLLAE